MISLVTLVKSFFSEKKKKTYCRWCTASHTNWTELHGKPWFCLTCYNDTSDVRPHHDVRYTDKS